jgi:hypothetical protein
MPIFIDDSEKSWEIQKDRRSLHGPRTHLRSNSDQFAAICRHDALMDDYEEVSGVDLSDRTD